MFGQNKNMRIRGSTAAIAMLAICIVLCIRPVGAQSTFPHEYRIKAAFLYEVVKFMNGWKFQQETEANSDQRPIIIGIIGTDPFLDAFGPLKAKRVRKRKVVIRYFKGFSDLRAQGNRSTLHPDIEDIRKCDLLFISSSEQQYTDTILGPIRYDCMLTVADMPGFLERGGIFNFVTEKHKVRFEINTAGAQRARLTIRSQLLRLATRVIDEDGIKGN